MAKETNSIQSIPMEKIHDLPGTEQEQQPDKAYGSLVSSILINGVKEPVILRPMENGDYQLVSGYRRKRAAELAKLKELPAQVYDMTEKEALDYRTRAAKDPKAPLPGQPVKEAGRNETRGQERNCESPGEESKKARCQKQGSGTEGGSPQRPGSHRPHRHGHHQDSGKPAQPTHGQEQEGLPCPR